MLVAEAFLKTLVEKYGKHTVYCDINGILISGK